MLLLSALFPGLNAWAQWTLPATGAGVPNAATALGSDCFRITIGANTRGVVWNNTQINLTQPFDISLTINQAPWGADGLALVLQSTGTGANGAGANALGFGASIPPTPGYPAISPSVAFEVDTWDNTSAGVADIAQDHVAIHLNGNMASTLAGPVSALASGMDITDGLCHTFRVTWEPGLNRIRLYFDNNTVWRLSTIYDLTAWVFGGNPNVWWGITGASGGAGMTQTVCVGANFAQAGPDRSICAGDTAHLQATGGISYTWSPAPLLNNATIANPVFGPAATGTHTVWTQATNAAGCTDRDTTLITVEAIPTANPGPIADVCLGDSIQIGAGPSPGLTYAWSPPTLLNNPNLANPWCAPIVIGPLNYTLIVTDTLGQAGCADTATLALTVLDTPSLNPNATPDTVCRGGSVTLSTTAIGGAGGYAFLWSNAFPGPSQSVIPTNSGSYGLTVTDAANCMAQGLVTVTVVDTPLVSLNAVPASICGGQSSLLTGLPSIGMPPYSLLWSNGAITPTTTVNPFTTTTYVLTATDSMGCIGRGAVTVTVNVGDSIDILQPDTLNCLGGSITVNGTFGSPGINQWVWSPSTGVSNPNAPNPTITPNASTVYYLTGTNTSTGCGYRDSLLVTYVPLGPPSLNLGNDTLICAGDSLLLDATNPGFQWLWSDGSSLQTLTVNASSNPWVQVSDTQGCGYLVADTIAIAVQALPFVALGVDTTICAGDSILLAGPAGMSSWIWSNGASGPAIWVAKAGTYALSVLDPAGCSGSDTMTLAQQPQPIVGFGTLAGQYCLSDPATLLNGNPAGGTWTGAAAGIFDPANAGVGSHWVVYAFQDSIGCAGADSQLTAVLAPPSPAQAGSDQQGEASVQLQAVPPTSGTGQWLLNGFPGILSDSLDPAASAITDQSGTFALVWSVSNPPCPAEFDTVLVILQGLHVPTGFSPNGDGVNDTYFIRGLGSYPGTKLQVLNRWGQALIEFDDYQNNWDGRGRDLQPLVEDTYYIVLEYGDKEVGTYVVLKR
ncbi:MAG: gliding motility-associated C-terminal domain-containing protein [Bacteroidia bacterium]